MKFDNSRVRRRDRLLEEGDAMQLLGEGEYGVLSMADSSGEGPAAGYGVPLNYVLEGGRIYFHCAPEGMKLDLLARSPLVGFCVVGATEVQPDKFSTLYRSVMVAGRASIADSDTERMHALELILRKYSPAHLETGLLYAQKSFHRTTIIRVDITSVSGKSKNTAHTPAK